MTAWTPPQHTASGASLPSSTVNAQVIDNLQFLHDGVSFLVGTPDDLSATVVPIANRAIACPLIPRDLITLGGLTHRVGTATGNCDVGIYQDDGNGTTATRLTSSGSKPLISGTNTVTFTSQQLQPYTKYWLAIAFSSAAARTSGTDGPYSLLCKIMDTAFTLPATFTFGATPSVSPCLLGLG